MRIGIRLATKKLSHFEINIYKNSKRIKMLRFVCINVYLYITSIMPSKTPAQQRLMGLALSIKRGKKSISSLPKGLQSKVRPLLHMTDDQLSDFAKTRFKEIVADIVNEILNENEDNNISDSKDIEVANFENYLKLPQNIGISFTQKEKDSTLIPNLPAPFAKSIFEIRYKSVEGVMSDGSEVKTNKTTVIKKIRIGETMMYKSFTLLEPTEEPKKDGSEEELKEADVAPTGQQPKPTVPPPQLKPEQKKQKVIEKTSQSFTAIQGDIELFINFLKNVNDDIGL